MDSLAEDGFNAAEFHEPLNSRRNIAVVCLANPTSRHCDYLATLTSARSRTCNNKPESQKKSPAEFHKHYKGFPKTESLLSNTYKANPKTSASKNFFGFFGEVRLEQRKADTGFPPAPLPSAPPSHCQNQAALPAGSFPPGGIRTKTLPFHAQTSTSSGTT